MMAALLCMVFCRWDMVRAQDAAQYRKIVGELSSERYQGRGYAGDGVRKAAKYIASQFRRAGADNVDMQSFSIDINTFPGKMEMSVDGHRLVPGDDFVMREYSPGAKGEYPLYYVDTLNYDGDRMFKELEEPAFKDAYVVCDFWFSYKHKQDFKRLEKGDEAPNAGIIYTWDTPLKFYKAYGEKVVDKPVIWVSSAFPRDAQSVTLDIRNKFREGYDCGNVIALVEGESHDSCYVFTAHYDHLGRLGRNLFFPGANDNASGTAALITLAEHYAANTPKFDMYFIAFAGEEANLRGSTYQIENPSMPLESIKYLFNLDMIGDDNPEQYCEVSEAGMDGFRKMERLNDAGHYFSKLRLGILAANSDHWPFAQRGVPCILFENEGGSAFPYYHTAHDDMSTFRMETYKPLMRLVMDFVE